MFDKRMPKVFRTQSVTAAPQDCRPFQVRRVMCVCFFSGLWPIQCATLAEIWRRCHYSTIKFRNRKIKAVWLETILQNGWLNHANIMPKPRKYRQNGNQNPSKIDEKSRLRRGCVFGLFWGAKRCPHIQFPGPFWEPFSPKIRKKALKKVCKKLCRKSIEN